MGVSLCNAQGHGLCSENRDRCGNYLNGRRGKMKHSWSVRWGWVCVGRLRVRFSDSRVYANGFKHSGISPFLMLSHHHPTHHSTHPLISPWSTIEKEKKDVEGGDVLRSKEV